MCVKISEKAKEKGNNQILMTLAELRKKACESLEKFKEKHEMNKFWLRTAKAFIDCSLWTEAEYCFGKINLQIADKEVLFNFYFWKMQMDFYRELSVLSDLSTACQLLDDLPHEKFRLARFLYCEVSKNLYSSKKYGQLKEILLICQQISQNAISESLEEINHKSKILLCQVYIDLTEIENAEMLLSCLSYDQSGLFLKLRVYLHKDDFNGIQELISEMIKVLTEDELLQAVDIMVSVNKLVDACKALLYISEKYPSGKVFLK